MARIVDNISLGKDYQRNNSDSKGSPIFLRSRKQGKGIENMAVTHVGIEHNKANGHAAATNGDFIKRADSLDYSGNTSPVSDLTEEMDIARCLATDFVGYKTNTVSSRPPSAYAETLRRVGDEMEEKYEITLNGIINQLKYNPNGDGRRAFDASLDAMFDSGACNWGRVVMVYVFAARLAKYCQKKENHDVYVKNLVDYCGEYVSEHLTDWIKDQGGWNDFCNKFKAKDWKDQAVFNSLLGTGLVLGGMALLRLLTK